MDGETSDEKDRLNQENVRNFHKRKLCKYLIKYYIVQKSFSLKVLFLCFELNYVFNF